MNAATFILSTGRCGTQWIASTLAEAFPDLLDVEHEPLHCYDDASESLQNHLSHIELGLKSRPYLECGHPCWRMLPHLLDRFQGRIRIIHLTRHPILTAYSWLTHGAFQEPLLPHLPPKILASPFDQETRFTEYQSRWDDLSAFERCLYYWGEVNALAADLQSQADAPWLRLRYEDLFNGHGLGELLKFLNLPERPGMSGQTNEVVDQFRYLSGEWEDWRVIEKHPRIMEIARGLGYGMEGIDETALRNRYLGA